jgi:hypothetical protein
VLNINDLKPGMVLADDVTNKHGNVLLGKGNQLSEKHIGVLKAWGVTEVNVEGADREQVDREEAEGLSSEAVASVEEKLKELFPDLGDNHLMQEIYRVVKKFKMKDMMAEKSEAGS